jgi:hypothetical protein
MKAKKPRTAFSFCAPILTAFFVLLSGHATAQGTEAALSAAAVFIVMVLTVLLLALAMLLVYLFTRNRVIGMVSYGMGALLLLVGLAISTILGDHHSSDMMIVSNGMTMAGMINLAAVFGADLFLRRKKVQEPGATSGTEPPAIGFGHIAAKWLSLVLFIWFIYAFVGLIEFWREISRYSDDVAETGIYLQLVMLVLNLAAVITFTMRRRVGWYLAFAYMVYSLASYMAFIFRYVIFPTSGAPPVPGGMITTNILITSGVAVVVCLLALPSVRRVFFVTGREAIVAAIAGVLMTAITQIAT